MANRHDVVQIQVFSVAKQKNCHFCHLHPIFHFKVGWILQKTLRCKSKINFNFALSWFKIWVSSIWTLYQLAPFLSSFSFSVKIVNSNLFFLRLGMRSTTSKVMTRLSSTLIVNWCACAIKFHWNSSEYEIQSKKNI